MKTLLWPALAAGLLLQQTLSVRAEGNDDFNFFEEENKLMVATLHEQTPEQAPSIVYIVTRHDIEAYGARDLADILRLVPGFEFGVDVYSEAGPAFRGIWVEEGKLLLMINGIMQNELGFGNYSFFGSIPASMIEKVEIIRGPGSAVYGGFAEAAVINVITHQPEKLNEMRVNGDLSAVSRYGNISYGSRTETMRVAAHMGQGETLLSRRDYTDFFGNRLELDRNTAYRRWQHLITEASAKDLTIRYQRTSFTFGSQDTFTTIQPTVNGINLEQTNNYNDVTHLDYNAKIFDSLEINPLFEYTRNNTWNFNFPASIDGYLEGSGTTLWRYRGEISALYETPWSAEMKLGGGYIRDGVQNVASDGTPGLQLSADPADRSDHTYTSATFGLFQYMQQAGPVGLTVGGRYEDTSFGAAIAPRAGLTYVHDAFNAKLLYGRAFRIPLPWQAFSRVLTFNGDLKPEIANTTEMEIGYKFKPQLKGKLNFFFIDINKPIVYLGATNKYVNLGRIISKGIEAELRMNYTSYGGFANFSYTAPGHSTSPGFVTSSKNRFLATPPVKITFGTYYRAGYFEFAPSATYLDHRAGQSRYSANDPAGIPGTTDYKAIILTDMNIIVRDALKDVDIHLTGHNIFNARYTLIQPYYGAHAPMPAQDREITLGVTWHL